MKLVPPRGHSVPDLAPRTAGWLIAAPYVMLGVVLAGGVVLASHPLTMPDTFFNLRFGHEFLSGHWSLTNPGTGTPFATAHWTPTQWSSEMGLAYVERHLGLAGVCWVMGTLVFAYIATVYRLVRVEAGALAAVLATVVTAFIAAPSLSPRAQVISYLFTAVFVAAVMRMRTDGRIRWWLVPLMWIWVTAHGMWPVGLSVLAVGTVGMVLESRSRAVLGRMAGLLGLLLVATAITPVGPRIYASVLSVSSRHTAITEWAPTNFMSPTNLLLAACVAALVVAGVRHKTAMPWTETLLLALGIGWALYATRGVPVAATILAPQLARAVQRRVPNRPAPAREGWIVATLVVAASAVLALLVTSQPGPPFAAHSWESTALDAMPAGTVVLNDEPLGGYLLWRYPGLSISADGYFDTFTDAELSRIIRMDNAQPGWIADVRASGARVALLSTDSPLAYGLVQTLHWTVVHSDASYQLLHAPSTAAASPAPPIG